MDALPFIIEMLLETPFKDFLSKNEPNILSNLNFVVQELLKVHIYMRWRDFEKQPEDKKQELIMGLRLTVHKVGKFMRKMHAQYATNSSQDHDSHKTIDELVKEWGDILNIFAGIVYYCYELKGNQMEEEFSLGEVYGEEFSLDSITGSSDDPRTADQQVVQPERLDEQKSLQLFLLKACPVLTDYSEPSQKKTFLLELSKELDNIPQLICKACHGSPLALILVGSLLSLKETINDVWKGVKDALYEFNDDDRRLLDIINYCYEDLPYFLKPCFRYLACYPKGYTIPTRSLINIWIAEGFISAEGKEETVEETAYK